MKTNISVLRDAQLDYEFRKDKLVGDDYVSADTIYTLRDGSLSGNKTDLILVGGDANFTDGPFLVNSGLEMTSRHFNTNIGYTTTGKMYVFNFWAKLNSSRTYQVMSSFVTTNVSDAFVFTDVTTGDFLWSNYQNGTHYGSFGQDISDEWHMFTVKREYYTVSGTGYSRMVFMLDGPDGIVHELTGFTAWGGYHRNYVIMGRNNSLGLDGTISDIRYFEASNYNENPPGIDDDYLRELYSKGRVPRQIYNKGVFKGGMLDLKVNYYSRIHFVPNRFGEENKALFYYSAGIQKTIYNDDLSLIGDDFTVSTWYRTITEGPSHSNYFFWFYNSVSKDDLFFGTYTHGFNVIYRPLGSTPWTSYLQLSSVNIPFNIWRHVTLTYSRSNKRLRIYVNSILKGESTIAEIPMDLWKNSKSAIKVLDNSNYTTGDEHSSYRYYTRELSPEEVYMLYTTMR